MPSKTPTSIGPILFIVTSKMQIVPERTVGRFIWDSVKFTFRYTRARTSRAAQAGALVCKQTGAPGRTRTDNIQLRRLALYPVELRARTASFTLALPFDGANSAIPCDEQAALLELWRVRAAK